MPTVSSKGINTDKKNRVSTDNVAKEFNLILLKYRIDNFLTKFTIKPPESDKIKKYKLVSKSFLNI